MIHLQSNASADLMIAPTLCGSVIPSNASIIGFAQFCLEKSINEKLIEDKFKNKISERDLTIQELRDMKSKLSTKMVGETLEIHCETQFNLNRASSFKNSYFEKDNDVTSGSKGDYIFREFDENKTEVVSIMFEMKNESLNGTNKRKNVLSKIKSIN